MSLTASGSPEATVCGSDSLLHCSKIILYWYGAGSTDSCLCGRDANRERENNRDTECEK